MSKILESYNKKFQEVKKASDAVRECNFTDPDMQKLANLTLAIADAISPDISTNDIVKEFMSSMLGE